MSRRSLTLAIASVATVAAIAVAVLFPVPYVILTPGPTTYSTSGHLNLVTISYMGGPESRLNIFQALRAWLAPSEAVVPQTEIFPAGQSAQETQAQDTQQMASSQELAPAAALSELHIGYQPQVKVLSTVAGYPASKSLKVGDVIEAVDGKPVTTPAALSSAITARPAGSTLQLQVMRGTQTLTVPVTSKASNGTPVIGVNVEQNYKFPFNVQITVGAIGGGGGGGEGGRGPIAPATAAHRPPRRSTRSAARA